MAQQVSTKYVSKTQLYLKVKKPLLERKRRARMNKCLDTLKTLVAEFQGDDAILRLDKAEMLEAALVFMRKELTKPRSQITCNPVPLDSFKNGYMNAVSEISRVMACTQDMSVDIGKTVMTHLGYEFQRMLSADKQQCELDLSCKSSALLVRSESPASSGYHSDAGESVAMSSPKSDVWRPW